MYHIPIKKGQALCRSDNYHELRLISSLSLLCTNKQKDHGNYRTNLCNASDWGYGT